MIKDFIRHLGEAIFAMIVVALMLVASVALGLLAVWLFDPPYGWDVAVFIVTALLFLIATAMTIEDRIG